MRNFTDRLKRDMATDAFLDDSRPARTSTATSSPHAGARRRVVFAQTQRRDKLTLQCERAASAKMQRCSSSCQQQQQQQPTTRRHSRNGSFVCRRLSSACNYDKQSIIAAEQTSMALKPR